MSAAQEGVRPPRSASEIVFQAPTSVAEARRRIADLDYDIAHIDQQIESRRATGSIDFNWWHRAMRARMSKDLERSRLRIWIEEERASESWDMLKAIVETAKRDYEPEEWADLLREARASLESRGAR